MRVLFLSVSAGFGGAERVLLDAVTALRSRYPEWTLGVVCLAPGPLAGEFEALHVDVRVVPLPPRFAALGESGRSTLATVVGLAGSAWALRSYTRRLRTHMAAWRPDVVHANGLKADVLAAWAAPHSAQIVWHVHDYVGARRVSTVLLRRYARRVAFVIANSRSVATDLQKVLGARARIEIVHNGIDTGRFGPTGDTIDLDAAANLPPAPLGTIRVGLVATYARWKGHEVFLRALARIGHLPVRGYVVGGPLYETSGSQFSRSELERLARTLEIGDRVGFVPFQRDIAPVYRSLDIVVHASTRPEPFGLVVAEAMASGRAVIISDAGGVRELAAGDEDALMHPPGDADALASRIASLVKDAALRERLATHGRTKALRMFDRGHLATGLAGLYTSLETRAGAACGAHAGVPVR
jgi:glycosyltransferase involved in cell wall biosynthesis